MLFDFEDEIALPVVDGGVGNAQGGEDRRKRSVGELHVNHVAENLTDPALLLLTHIQRTSCFD